MYVSLPVTGIPFTCAEIVATPAACAGATYTICVPVTLMMFAAGIATPSMSTVVFAVETKPKPVSVTLFPPAVFPDTGLIPVSPVVFMRENATVAAPGVLAVMLYVPAELFALPVTLATPLAFVMAGEPVIVADAPLTGGVKATAPPLSGVPTSGLERVTARG
jgi:hypothetical protein